VAEAVSFYAPLGLLLNPPRDVAELRFPFPTMPEKDTPLLGPPLPRAARLAVLDCYEWVTLPAPDELVA
jgi:hypothetical protein